MNTYTINNTSYYLSDELKKTYPEVFKGCHNTRTFASKYVPEGDYVYARQVSNKWCVTDGKSNKFDKVFVRCEWFDDNCLEDPEDVEDPEDTDTEKLEIIKLEETEKFHDDKGNVVEILVCGEREYDKCYFLVTDIARGFDMPRLHNSIIDERGSYLSGRHYKYFCFNKTEKLFLTYEGMIKLLYSSRSKSVNKFVDWATKTLFTAQLGTTEQRQQLSANILGVSANVIKEVFSKTSTAMPCIYLISLGQVKILRKLLNLDKTHKDNDYVYKWGNTIDFKRRMAEHERDFKKSIKQNIDIVLFEIIDPQYVTTAETKIAHMFNNLNLRIEHEKYTELAVIPANKMKYVKEEYELLAKAYVGHNRELVTKIKEKDAEIEILKRDHIIELQKSEAEKEQYKYKCDMLEKALENERLKNELEKLRKKKN